MTKTNMFRSHTLPQLRGALALNELAVEQAIASVNLVRSEIARRENAKIRAKQAAAGTKQLQVTSLRKGMELKVYGGFSKITQIGVSHQFFERHSARHVVLANGKTRNLSISDRVTVKA